MELLHAHKKIVFLIITVVILLIIATRFFHPAEATHRVPVTLAPVTLGNIAPNFTAVGNIVTENTVDIKPRIDGQIINIPVNRGDEVQKNQLLFVIDPKPFQASVDQAKANLAKDQATQLNAAAELTRYQKLIKPGYISKEYFDQIKSNAATAKATVAADQAALESAEIQLGYTQIHAPISGRLGDINPHLGDLITASSTTPLTTINQFKPIDVQFSLPSQNLPVILKSFQSAQPVQVTVTPDANQTASHTGKLYFINNQVDTTTGTVMMKAKLDNLDESLWPGEFVNVQITLPSLQQITIIPTIALQQDQHQQYYVYIVDNQQVAHLRPVTVGFAKGRNTSILSGLRVGEKVVVKGQFEIGDNSLVSNT